MLHLLHTSYATGQETHKYPGVGDVARVRVEPVRLAARPRHSHRVTEPRRIHALRVRDVSTDQRQTQHRSLHVLLRPVADQLAVGDDAVALCPAEQSLVVETAGELDVPQTRHAAAAAADNLARLLLDARSTSTIFTRHTHTNKPSFFYTTSGWCVASRHRRQRRMAPCSTVRRRASPLFSHRTRCCVAPYRAARRRIRCKRTLLTDCLKNSFTLC